MMSPDQRETALTQMQKASNEFYRSAVFIGNHPFIEFAGLMNEYINACHQAHARGIDFTECSVHSGQLLPLHPVMSDYLNEKLECIFAGSKILDASAVAPAAAETIGRSTAASARQHRAPQPRRRESRR